MKYICLGYINEKEWASATEAEQKAMMDECFAYDDELKRNGHFIGGEALQHSQNAIVLKWVNRMVAATDWPVAETTEKIGGIMILDATVLNHAMRVLSNHPWLRVLRDRCRWEIRPAADLNAMVEEIDRRR